MLQLCKGSDLKEYINKYKKLSEEKAKKIFLQILNAVSYCHDQGIFHRDLKLENIMINKEEEIKLIDFGFATILKGS